LKHYRDWKNTLDTAEAKGARNKQIEIAKNLIKAKVDIETIQNATGLSREIIIGLTV